MWMWLGSHLTPLRASLGRHELVRPVRARSGSTTPDRSPNDDPGGTPHGESSCCRVERRKMNRVGKPHVRPVRGWEDAVVLIVPNDRIAYPIIGSSSHLPHAAMHRDRVSA